MTPALRYSLAKFQNPAGRHDTHHLPDQVFLINCRSVRLGIRMVISGIDTVWLGMNGPG
jgi:hypothetical protein